MAGGALARALSAVLPTPAPLMYWPNDSRRSAYRCIHPALDSVGGGLPWELT